MQRLGFCKWLLVDGSRGRSAAALAKLLGSLAETKFRVAADERLLECLRGRSTAGRPKMNARGAIEISLQDYYICSHPSKSGWLSRLAPKEYAERLPRYLGLLDSAYRVTEFGQVLALGLVREEEKEALRRISLDVNPLTLTLPQKVFFLYILLAKDGDFLIPFTKALSDAFGAGAFSYLEAGDVLPRVLRTLVERFAGAGYSRAEREQLRQLRSALADIEQAITAHLERHGSGSRREQTTIPRMEWLIDLGLVEKAPSAETVRRYQLTDCGCSFVSAFSAAYEEYLRVKYPEEALDTLLDHEFFALAQQLYSPEQLATAPETDVVEYLRPAYQILSGVSGYCVIRPLLLLANTVRIEEGLPVAEYADVVATLEQAYRANPERVYYTVTRLGADYQVRLGG